MIEIIEETLIDSIKLLPFLFITYLIMEYIEHKTSDKLKNTIKKSGKYGPVIGGLLGTIPQCGFSVAATNLYATRIITLGTLISVYLATSDEMIPILLSEGAPITTILLILGIKLVIAIIAGFIIDFIIRRKNKENNEEERIIDLCEKEHCHCEHGIFKSALKHTLNIFVFIIDKSNTWSCTCRHNWINTELCIICYINSVICRKCYISSYYDFRIVSWNWNRTCCSI